MFRSIKQVFIMLLSFIKSAANKCVSSNNEQCMVRPTLADLNPVDFNYYPFMISLDKCNRGCNAVGDLSTKICVPSKIKDGNVKVFNNMITRINEAKSLIKHISWYCKHKFNSTICNSNQKWNGKCLCECKKYRTCKKDYSTCISDNGRYLKVLLMNK